MNQSDVLYNLVPDTVPVVNKVLQVDMLHHLIHHTRRPPDSRICKDILQVSKLVDILLIPFQAQPCNLPGRTRQVVSEYADVEIYDPTLEILHCFCF